MNSIVKILSIVFLTFFPFIVFGGDIGGTGWFVEEDDGDKKIILFEKYRTFTFLNVKMWSGNGGNVFSEDGDTWLIAENLVVISFSDGYRICSLNLITTKSMLGTCINKIGLKNEVTLRLIE